MDKHSAGRELEQAHKEESQGEATDLLVSSVEAEIWGHSDKVLHVKLGIRASKLLEPEGWESKLIKVATTVLLGCGLF
jgi:hypothetical protein